MAYTHVYDNKYPDCNSTNGWERRVKEVRALWKEGDCKVPDWVAMATLEANQKMEIPLGGNFVLIIEFQRDIYESRKYGKQDTYAGDMTLVLIHEDRCEILGSERTSSPIKKMGLRTEQQVNNWLFGPSSLPYHYPK